MKRMIAATVAVMLVFLLTGCGVLTALEQVQTQQEEPTSQVRPESPAVAEPAPQIQEASPVAEASASSEPASNGAAPPTDTYWKAVGYDSDVLDINETTAELFLWADGSGFFRITQESARVGDYGFPDSFDCRWSKNESSLLLTGVDPTDRGSDEMTGIFEDGRLALAYKGLYGDSFSIFFEQADMPVEVAQEDKQIFESSWELFEAAGGDILTFSRWLYGEVSGQRGVLNPDGSYSYSETLDDGNVEFTLTREKALQISDMVAVAEFFVERSGEISDLNVSPDDALSEALGYPAYEVSYGTLGNVGSRAHKAVFVGADEWDFIVEVAVNEEVYGNYWVDVEQLLDNLTWLSTD